jgi:hypothetical protein
VGRFNARTKVREGEVIEIAVDTRSLHFFDIDGGLCIYDGAGMTDEGARPTIFIPEEARK